MIEHRPAGNDDGEAPVLRMTIIRPDGKGVEQGFKTDKITVGRHESCDLRLVDSMVSRTHCTIFREGRRLLVKDLQSRNGTWLNGRRIQNRGDLRKDDVIQIGPFRIILEPNFETSTQVLTSTIDLIAPGNQPYVHRDRAERVIEPLGMISSYLSETTEGSRLDPARVRRERLNRNLLALYRITEDLVIKEDLDEILERIMDHIFETFSPSQATILLRDNDGHPTPRKQRHSEGKQNIRAISQTIIGRILSDRVGVLTDNALEDPRFEMGDSVIIDGIRSVMAAPIWEEKSILGVLYVDSLDIEGGYQSEDLDLLTAIGHQTALAVQRWNLAEKLKGEAVKNAVMRETLRRFHSPQVVDLILKGAADLEARETEATILFCDIVGFTTMCESRSPIEIRAVLNLFFKTVNEAVFREQGTLDKFIGDGALAIFGAPLPQEDAAARAVRCALEIRERLAGAMNSLRRELRFRVRYGIDSGNAVVGNFGSDERMEYTILGHAVNVASRITKEAEPDRILIGPTTLDQVSRRSVFQVRGVGSKRLKGVKGSINLYEVEGFV
jgi:adenylate cyclase